MRHVVTGGCGSIGSELARQLVARGDEVVIIDNLSGGSLDNIADIADRVSCHVADICDPDGHLLQSLIDRCDTVFHLAASLGVHLILEKPLETMHNNVEGTRLVLAAAARTGKPVLVASTSEVYGLSERLPFCEDEPVVLGPSIKSRWSYANSKLHDEFLALAYMQQRGVPVIIPRYFNATGRQQSSRYGMVVPTFIRQALAGDPLTVHGDGTQSRCFADVRDTVKATIRLMDAKAFGQVVNVGSQSEITIGELARLVKRRTHSPSIIQCIPYERAYSQGYQDMPRRIPSLDKLRALTGFVPTIPITEIIDRTVEWIEAAERPQAVAA